MVDREVLRGLILRSMITKSDWGYTLDMIYDSVRQHFKGKESPDLRVAAVEEIFQMLSQGLITPHYDFCNGTARLRWDCFHLSTYGKSIYEQASEHPFYVREYLQRLKSLVSNKLDPVIEFYVDESLALFQINRYTSSVLMLGVASEKVVEMMCDSVLKTLEGKTRTEFQSIVDKHNIEKKIFRLSEIIKSTCTDKDLMRSFEHLFDGFVTILRIARNDCGHPKGFEATRDDCLNYLLMFPKYVERMYLIMEFFESKVVNE